MDEYIEKHLVDISTAIHEIESFLGGVHSSIKSLNKMCYANGLLNEMWR